MIRSSKEMKTETREKMRGGAGSVVIRHYFDKDEFSANVRLCAVLNLVPGSGIGMHQHLNEDEVYVVINGSGIIDDGKVRKRVTAGDAVLTGKGESHAIYNDGTVPLEVIAIIHCYEPKS